MTDFEEKVIGFIGESKKALEVLEQGQRDQGARLGTLEAQFHAHEKEFANRNTNGNGWKAKGAYAGSGVVLFELAHRLGGMILEAMAK